MKHRISAALVAVTAALTIGIAAAQPAAAAGQKLWNSGGSSKNLGYRTSAGGGTAQLAPGTYTSDWTSVYQFASPYACPIDIYRKKVGSTGGWSFYKREAGTPASWTWFSFSAYAGTSYHLLVKLDC